MANQAEPWERLRELFHRALDETAPRRRAWLEQLGQAEPALAQELEALLAAHEQAADFLEDGVAADAPEMAGLWQAAVAGMRIGPYRVIRELGRGGMGAVYLAHRDNASYQQQVALKLIKRGMDTEEILRRFLAERQILATLIHPHIARLLDGGSTEDGRPFLVMELIHGEPIDLFCERRGLDLSARLRLFLAVAEAVHFAHQHLVVHRDLKPANILVNEHGIPKLLDFGIAKLLADGPDEGGATLAGQHPRTPDYASPEQLSGGAITTATDVHGLGVLLFELAAGANPLRIAPAGRPPLASQAAGGKLARRLSGDFDAIVAKALAPEPSARYPSARELAADLERFLERKPVEARRPTLAYRVISFVRRHRLASAAAAALAVLGLTATILAVALGRERLEVRAQSRRSAALAEFLLNIFKVADPGTNRGATVTARELLEAGTAELSRESQSLEPTTRAFLLERVGEVYQNLGLYPEAQSTLERSLLLSAAGDFDKARTRVLLAAAHRDQGDLETAHRLLEEALAIQLREAGPSSLPVAKTLAELGWVDQLGKELEQGRKRLHEAIAIQRQAGPAAELDLAESLSNLATLELDAERPEVAEPLRAEALAVDRRRLGEDHPRTIVGRTNLAAVLYRQGDYEQAERLTREVLGLRRRVLGEDHPELAETYVSLSTIARQRGEGAAAEQAARQAVAIFERRGLISHNSYDDALNNLATILLDRGAQGEAESTFRRVLAHYEADPATPPAELANLLNNLAQLVREQGAVEEAERLLRRAVSLWRQALGPESPGLASTLNSLGGTLNQAQRWAEAEAAYREALTMRRKLLGPEHLAVSHSLVNLGSLLVARRRAAEAEPLLTEGLRLRRQSLPPGHFAIGQAEGALGACYLALERWPQASALLESSERLLLAARGAGHPDVILARKRLAELGRKLSSSPGRISSRTMS